MRYGLFVLVFGISIALLLFLIEYLFAFGAKSTVHSSEGCVDCVVLNRKIAFSAFFALKTRIDTSWGGAMVFGYAKHHNSCDGAQ